MSAIILGAIFVALTVCLTGRRKCVPLDAPVLVAAALPHTPVFAQDTPAPEPEEASMTLNTYMGALRKRVRKALNYRIAEYMRANAVPMSAWDTITRSTIVVTEDDGVFVGAWGTRDEAVEAIMALDHETREDVLTTMDVAFPRTQAELDGYAGWTRAHLDALEELQAAQYEREHAEIAAMAVGRDMRIQPVFSTVHTLTSTERMREVRAEHKRNGLTVRGTAPLPYCGAPTRTGAPCKRKAQRVIDANNVGHTIGCDWHARRDIEALRIALT